MEQPTPTTACADWTSIDEDGLRLAVEQARKSYEEGGIPIGAVILIPMPTHESDAHKRNYKVLGKGHNQRIQKSSAILHGEMDALEDAGRLRSGVYRRATMYTTLSPCSMCTGAILLYKIPRVVIGEHETFFGGEELLRKHGVEVVVKDDEECKEIMRRFVREKPEEWYEDIGLQREKNPEAGY